MSSRRRAGRRSRAEGAHAANQVRASTRAAIYLIRAANAHAFIQGRAYIMPEGHQGARHRPAASSPPADLSRRRRGHRPRCTAGQDLRDRSSSMTPEEIMRKARRIEITTRHLVRDIVAREYSGAFRGRESSSPRSRISPETISTVSTGTSRRLGSAYVKRYLEERELTVSFVVNFSASEQFGGHLRPREARPPKSRRPRAGGRAE